MQVRNNRVWEYEFPIPTSDYRAAMGAAQIGACADLTGVDGRFVGSLRRHPGFVHVPYYEEGMSSTRAANPIRIWNFAIQKGYSETMLRGFVVLDGADDVNKTIIVYAYDEESLSWSSHTIDLGEAYFNRGLLPDVASDGRFIHIAVPGDLGITLFHNGDNWVETTLGYWQEPDFVSRAEGGEFTTEFTREFGEGSYVCGLSSKFGQIYNHIEGKGYISWDVLVRLGDSRRGVWTAPSIATVYAPMETGYWFIGHRDISTNLLSYLKINLDEDEAAEFDTIEVYRTVANGSNLFREIYYTTSDKTGARTVLKDYYSSLSGGGTIYLWLALAPNAKDAGIINQDYPYLHGTMSDAVLLYQDQYDMATDNPGPPLYADAVFCAGGITFVAISGEAEGLASSFVRWSSTTEYSPGTFPYNNVYYLAKGADPIYRFIGKGNVIYGFSESAVYRFTITGGTVVGEQLTGNYGLLSYGAATNTPAGPVFLTKSGLVLILPTGELSLVSALDRVLNNDWLAVRDRVFLTYDQSMSALYVVLSPVRGDPRPGEAYLVWGGTNTVTRLTDHRWLAGCEGLSPTGDPPGVAAWFISDSGFIYRANDDSLKPLTMIGSTGLIQQHGEILVRTNEFTTEFTREFRVDSLGAGEFTREFTKEFGEIFINIIPFKYLGVEESPTEQLRDAYIYFISTEKSIPIRRKIVSFNDTSIILDSKVKIIDGARWSISPVVFKVVGWPLSGGITADLDLDATALERNTSSRFRRRTVIGVQVDISASGNFCFVGIHEWDRNIPSIQVPLPGNNAAHDVDRTVVHIPYSGTVLSPAISDYQPGSLIELHALAVVGTLGVMSKNTTKT